MPRSSASGTTGLSKLHDRECRKRFEGRKRPRLTMCTCDWYYRPTGYPAINLANWCVEGKADPHSLTAARAIIKRVDTAIGRREFDIAGERKTKTSGRTFAEYIEDWWKDILEAQGRPLDTRMPIEWQVIAYDHAKIPTQFYTPAPGALGHLALHDITVEHIEDWLKERRREMTWEGKKSYNEYHRIIQRFLERATKRRIIPFNPARAIERLKGMNQHRGEMRHFRFDDEVERKLFEVVDQLNRSYGPNSAAKLTQEKADEIRRTHERAVQGRQRLAEKYGIKCGAAAKLLFGSLTDHLKLTPAQLATLLREGKACGAHLSQPAIAAMFDISLTIVNEIIKGRIWNPAERTTTTKGSEMRRRLIGVFDISGPRAGEMLLITIDHVDWAHPKKLVDEKTGLQFNGYEIEMPPMETKGGKMTGETQYLYAATLRASQMLQARRFQLNKNPTGQRFIFGTEDGHYVASFDKSWHALFTLAGLKWGRKYGLVWHTTRAEFLSRVGDDPRNTTWDLKEAGRHAHIRTSERYKRQAAERRWAVAFRLNDR